MTALITALSVVIILGILVGIHELGHYVAAKLSGIDVEEFAIGFGPTLFEKKYLETNYMIKLIPFGGYVKLAGEDRNESDKDPEHFHNKPLLTKVFVLLAGIFMNMSLAVVLFVVFFAMTGYDAEIAKIVDFNFIGAEKVETIYPIYITDVKQDSAASKAGIQVGDVITAINGVRFDNVSDFKQLLKEQRGTEAKLEVFDLKNNTQTDATVLLPDREEDLLGVGLSLPRFGYYLVDYPDNVLSGLSHSINITIYQFPALAGLFSKAASESDPSIAASSVNGLVGVSAFVNEIVISEQFALLVNLTALVSISLAVVNLLPLPVLDGGQVVLAILEKARGRKFQDSLLEKINIASFAFVILLTLAITLKDVLQYEVVTTLADNIRKVLGL